MARLPVPGRPEPEPGLTNGSGYAVPGLPARPRHALRTLTDAGHEAVLVGGCLRDLLLGGVPGDWDVATSASPETVAALFPGSVWENRFGTVLLPGQPSVEITTYRAESGYADRRRPDEVRFHGSLPDDLARRDFTINAIAWRPDAADAAHGVLVDPIGGLDDLSAGVIRAVGRPADRFAEDALRVLRGVRFGLRFGFATEPATEEAMHAAAADTRSLSGERVRDELVRLLGDPRIVPSDALLRWEEIGLMRALLPELAALREVPQAKVRGGDALDHSLWTADGLPATDPVLRLAGLLHDLGKAETLADGHFIGHEVVGAERAETVLRRLRLALRDIRRVTHLIRHHMFNYDDSWTDAAVRRLINRVGASALDDLFSLREADDAASGVVEPARGSVAELRARIAEQRTAPLASRHLAVDGRLLMTELGLEAGPELGRILDRLLDAVIEDPSRNEREVLLALARDVRDSR